jgi:mono/diheme cytochrome c family protein
MLKASTSALLSVLLGSSAFAGDVATGQDLYLEHCAACHGLSAQGDGPMAPALMVKPKDLTQLANANDGSFPLKYVIKRIDGRKDLISHGSLMPVYGHFFEGQDVMLKTDAGQPVMTSQPIGDLISWLKSIQK